jgi:hypothetical protein
LVQIPASLRGSSCRNIRLAGPKKGLQASQRGRSIHIKKKNGPRNTGIRELAYCPCTHPGTSFLVKVTFLFASAGFKGELARKRSASGCLLLRLLLLATSNWLPDREGISSSKLGPVQICPLKGTLDSVKSSLYSHWLVSEAPTLRAETDKKGEESVF